MKWLTKKTMVDIETGETLNPKNSSLYYEVSRNTHVIRKNKIYLKEITILMRLKPKQLNLNL